jgi:hypothetical protein
MPGNLEALLILPEHASGVKQKPLSHKGFCPFTALRPAATKPVSRAPKAAKRTLDAGARTRPTTPTMDHGPGPAGALHSNPEVPGEWCGVR